jgi:hypothetical protein
MMVAHWHTTASNWHKEDHWAGSPAGTGQLLSATGVSKLDPLQPACNRRIQGETTAAKC